MTRPGNWTQVSRAIGEHSYHYVSVRYEEMCGRVKMNETRKEIENKKKNKEKWKITGRRIKEYRNKYIFNGRSTRLGLFYT